jgi:hypothetical protein
LWFRESLSVLSGESAAPPATIYNRPYKRSTGERYSTNRQDHHTISGGWGPWETKFVVTGHEVVGKVVEVGKNVTEFQIGQRVGVGAQVGSCGNCKACNNDNGEASRTVEEKAP